MQQLNGFLASILDPERADEFGLVAVGGTLRPDWLLTAYRRGVFPWYADGEPICWWSPDPRALIELDGLHIARRLGRTIRSGTFHLTINRAFAEVIRGCADRPGEGTWITADMMDAYETLHRLGHAHSVEAWQGDKLAGGLYGVALGGLFAAESMFTRVADAAKVALVYLVEHLKQRGFHLLDVQMTTPHSTRMGAIEIPRGEYLRRLGIALRVDTAFVLPQSTATPQERGEW
jgi:leucyl/phenylalanyl-tRNA--protein transferase